MTLTADKIPGRDLVADSLRGLTIILVIAGHVIDGFSNSGMTFPGSELIDDFIYSFHMPLMFMISGYADGMSHKSSGTLQQIKKSIINIYLPCLYFSLIFWLPKFLWSIFGMSNTENFNLATLNDLLMIPLEGFDLYWFLAALFFIKAIHILTQRFIPGLKLRALIWAVLFAVYESFEGVPRFCCYGLFFFTGFVLRQKNMITRENHPGIFRGIILFLAGIIFTALYFGGIGNFFTWTGAAMCSCLGLFIIFYALDIIAGFLVLCGANSMVIYVLHIFVNSSLRLILRRFGLFEAVNPVVLFVICCVIDLFVPLFVIWLYKNVKCLRWIEFIFYPGKLNPPAR